jgi:PAS domain S-box-containing protein
MSAAYTSTSFGISGPWLAEYTLDALGAGVVVFDSFGHIMQWSDRAAEILGAESETLAGRALSDPEWGVTDDAGNALADGRCPVSQVIRTGEIVAADVIVPQASGIGRQIAMRILPVLSHNGHVRGALASIMPVGERQSAPYRQRCTDQWVSFEYGILARIIVDRDGTIIDWNRELLAMTGFDDATLARHRFEDLCDLDLAWMWSALDAADGKSMEGWVSMRLADTSERLPVFGHFRQIGSRQLGDMMALELVDPTELQRPTGRTATLLGTEVFAAAAIPMLAVSDDGEIVDVNEAAAQFLGRPATSLRQEPAARVMGGFEPDELRQLLADARRAPGSVACGEKQIRHAGGSSTTVNVVVRAMRDGVRWPIVLLQLVPTQLLTR